MDQINADVFLQGTKYRVPGLEGNMLGMARSDNDGSLPPILFIHGAFSRASIWEMYFLDHFASAGFPAYAFDLRGRGTTGFSLMPPGLDDFLHDVRAAAGALAEPPIIIAHSMGGFLAQRLIGELPMRALVLMGTVPPLGAATANMTMATQYPFLWMNTALFSVNPLMGDIRSAANALFSSDMNRAEAKKVLRESVSESPRALMELQMPAVIKSARDHDLPTLVVGGRGDKLIPIAEQRHAASYHDAPFEVIDDLGHAMMVDTRWQSCAEKIEDWLNEII